MEHWGLDFLILRWTKKENLNRNNFRWLLNLSLFFIVQNIPCLFSQMVGDANYVPN